MRTSTQLFLDVCADFSGGIVEITGGAVHDGRFPGEALSRSMPWKRAKYKSDTDFPCETGQRLSHRDHSG